MTYLPVIAIVTADALINCRRVWAAMGLGDENFTIKICENVPGVTYETTPTHYAVSDNIEPELLAEWMALADGILPEIIGTWGEDGIIDEISALDATSKFILQVYGASGEVNPQQHLNGILNGRNLREIPWPIY